MRASRPGSQPALIAAAVLALHGLLAWLLLVRTGAPIPARSQSIELVLVPPPPQAPLRESRRALRPPAARARERQGRTPAGRIPDTRERQAQAARAPVDWGAELARAAQASAAAAARDRPKDFGFPPVEAPAKRPEFGWDHAATQRVQSNPDGGILVNLNDNCVLVFVPLPFVFCKPGHKPADGALFKDMAQPSLAGDLDPSP